MGRSAVWGVALWVGLVAGGVRAEGLLSPLHVQGFASDVMPVNVGVQLGEGLHAKAVLGMRPWADLAQPRWSLGVGLGTRLGLGPVFVDLDVMAHNLRQEDLLTPGANVLGQARALAGLRLGLVGLFGGPTLNGLYSFDGRSGAGVGPPHAPDSVGGVLPLRHWWGFVVGVEL